MKVNKPQRDSNGKIRRISYTGGKDWPGTEVLYAAKPAYRKKIVISGLGVPMTYAQAERFVWGILEMIEEE